MGNCCDIFSMSAQERICSLMEKEDYSGALRVYKKERPELTQYQYCILLEYLCEDYYTGDRRKTLDDCLDSRDRIKNRKTSL